LKTGYTETAGYCLISSAEREGMRLVSVLLGAKNAEARLTQSLALLNYGFRFFETRKLYQGGVPQLQARIWKGVSSELKMGLKDDLYITIPRGEYDKLQATTQLSEKIEAPVQSGEKMGSVSIHFYDEVLAERPLIALDTVQRGGVGKRVIDSIKLWFH
jgi:D-alanyl-D-alanine carboxypeptidase (penicillin-binding protein 5/6)